VRGDKMTCDPCGAISKGFLKKLPEGWIRSVDMVLFCPPCAIVAKYTGALKLGRPARRRFPFHHWRHR